jgi:hypothetical protein
MPDPDPNVEVGASPSPPPRPEPASLPTNRTAQLRRTYQIGVGAAALLGLAAVVLTLYVGPSKLYQAISTPEEHAIGETNSPGMQEWWWAQADHEIIAAAVAACSNLLDLDGQPFFVRAQLRLGTAPDGRYFELVAPRTSAPPSQPGTLSLSNFQRAVIYLSDAIARARFESASAASINWSRMNTFQALIVAIGAITTILISIKSISSPEQNKDYSRWFFWIGIAAIVFSAVGTAASALNSFYSPREAYVRNERTLSALRQLHSDIASRVTSVMGAGQDCGKFDPAKKDEPNGKQVDDWTTRLGTIVSGSDSTSASPTAGGGSPAGGGAKEPR